MSVTLKDCWHGENPVTDKINWKIVIEKHIEIQNEFLPQRQLKLQFFLSPGVLVCCFKSPPHYGCPQWKSWTRPSPILGPQHPLGWGRSSACLGVPGRSSSLPCLLIQLTTIWWSVDSSAPLATQVPETYSCRSAYTAIKSIIDIWPKVARWLVLSSLDMSAFSWCVFPSTLMYMIVLQGDRDSGCH